MIARSPASRGSVAAGRARVRAATTKKTTKKRTTARKDVPPKSVKKTVAAKTIARKTVTNKTVARKRVTKKAVAKKTTIAGKTTARKTVALKPIALETRFQKAVSFDSKAITRVSAKAAKAIADDSDAVAKEKIAKAKARETKPRHSLITPRNHKRSAVERLDDPPPAPVAVMLGRVSLAIERELTQIERIVGGNHVKSHQRTEAERRARTLASLARTLREVMQLRAGEEKKQDDDAVPRDIGEFRRQLARRLEQLAADAKAAHPGTDHGA